VSLTDAEVSLVHEWIARMENGEPGLFKKEIPGKIVLVDTKRIPKLSREQLNARIKIGELKKSIEIGHIYLYETQEP
jgi:hypothetical protein